MDINTAKRWDKNSKKYRFTKWLYLNFLFYFINVDHIGRPKFLPRIIGGQHFDAEQVASFINPNDGVMVDVGAERGEVADYFYRLGFKIYAIEPEVKNCFYLWVHNFLRVLSFRFHIYRLACGQETKEAELHISELSFRHSLKADEYSTDKVQKVKQVRIGDFINKKKLNKIALLKIDAEGFDLPILKGLFESTKVLPKVIMFEADKETIAESIALVKKHGYIYFRFICRWNEQPNVSYQKRIAVYDGIDPEVLSTGSNVICTREEFRVAHPIKA